MTTKHVGALLLGLFVGAWLGRALFVWILDVDRTWEIVAMVASALVGATIAVVGSVEETKG